MNKSDLKRIIKEEIQLAVFEQQLQESKLTDFLSKIKAAAVKAAKTNYEDAASHVNMEKLTAKPLPQGALEKAQMELEKDSQTLSEGFVDQIKQFAKGGLVGGGLGSVISGIVSIAGGLQYIDRSFNQWYYKTIQGMAESDVMKIMVDMYGAQAAEGSIWFKLGMYAFFVFFTIATLSFITLYIIKKTGPAPVDPFASFNRKAKKGLKEATLPSNVKSFAQRKGVLPLIMKIASWAEKAGKRIVGGTAVGKNYDSLILDVTPNGGEIHINLDTAEGYEEIKVNAEEVYNYNDFKKALAFTGFK
jgi:hypothetical protein